jgi:hypothetical protein
VQIDISKSSNHILQVTIELFGITHGFESKKIRVRSIIDSRLSSSRSGLMNLSEIESNPSKEVFESSRDREKCSSIQVDFNQA